MASGQKRAGQVITQLPVVRNNKIRVDAGQLPVEQDEGEWAIRQLLYEFACVTVAVYHPGGDSRNTTFDHGSKALEFRGVVGSANVEIVGDNLTALVRHTVRETLYDVVGVAVDFLGDDKRDRLRARHPHRGGSVRQGRYVGTAALFANEIALKLQLPKSRPSLASANAQLFGKFKLRGNSVPLFKFAAFDAPFQGLLDGLVYGNSLIHVSLHPM